MEDFHCTCTDDCVHTLPTVFFNDSTSTERSRRISPSYIATAAVISCTVHGFIAVGWSVDTLMYMTMYATSVKLQTDAQHSLRGRSPAPRGSPKFFDPLWPSPAMFNSEEHVHDPKSNIRPYSPVGA